MNAEELWKQSGLIGRYDVWAFGEAPDKLANFVIRGIKRGTSSALELYAYRNEEIPKVNTYSVILDSSDNAVCIIKDVKVDIVAYKDVTEEFAKIEGEGDQSLEYWREVHKNFFSDELKLINKKFDNDTKIVCEEFEVVFLPK